MIDQTTPPFAAGDVAYTRPSPGGYASAAAVPTDPAFAGTDKAYAVPSLGGEFQPGSGKPAPTNSAISKGADADGGAADIAGATRIDVPPAPTPPVIPALSATVAFPNIVMAGAADVAKTVVVNYKVNAEGSARGVTTTVPIGSSAGTAAALIAASMNANPFLLGSTTSNVVRVGTKAPHVLNEIVSVVITAAAGLMAAETPPPPEDEPDDDEDDAEEEEEETPSPAGRAVLRRKARKSK